MEGTLSCRELVEFLAEYLAGRLPPAVLERFRAHLAGCPDCETYARTYAQAVRLGRGAVLCPDEALPEDVPADLLRAVLAARGENA
jgi:anti-sigma factor RsiW